MVGGSTKTIKNGQGLATLGGVAELIPIDLGLLYKSSGSRGSVINLDPKPRKVGQQFLCRIVGGTLVQKCGFEMPIHDDCASTSWRDVGALYISRLPIFEAERKLSDHSVAT